MADDEFEPRLGRMRGRGGKPARRYLGRVLAAAARAGGVAGPARRRFDGSRIGRGASVGRLLSSRDRHAGLRSRRAIVKTRLVRLSGKGLSGARAHLRYVQRDGVTREGEPGALYTSTKDVVDGREFIERADGDRHQFRFIVSAEDGQEYVDLKPMIRRLMTQMEEDLGTRLDWVAVDHFNTAHPHTHIMLRGVDDRGDNLIIAREYISHGLRARAAEIVSLDLGPRTDLEIEARLRADTGQHRLTAIDRALLRDRDADGVVSSGDRDPFRQSLRAGRLQTLGGLGLAEDQGGGRWRLDGQLEARLRALGERGDIIRTMQRELAALGGGRTMAEHAIFDGRDGEAEPIVGRLVRRGLADEHRDRHYAIVDGVDGRSHYVDIGQGSAVEPIPDQAIVRVSARDGGIRDADRTIAAVAAASEGRYSVDLHLAHDPKATESFAEAHVRRLEAIRRLTGGVEREPDGSWRIGADHLHQVERYETRLTRDRPVVIETLSAMPLDRLGHADAATWLDRELLTDQPRPLREGGFGRDMQTALTSRRQWLIEQDLAQQDGDVWTARPDLLATLQRRELLRVAGALSDELGMDFSEARSGDRIEGVLARSIDLVSGRFVLVERAHDFTLVPWRPVLERQLGKQVGGIVRESGVSWQIGRARDGPEIS
jgi:type IV secretory pathway VirD2 relaxase